MLSRALAGLLLAAGASALRFGPPAGLDNAGAGDVSDALSDVLARGTDCDLCGDTQWLFIVGTGRSGSTTVMDMINVVPGFYISGENHGFFQKVSKLYADAEHDGFGEKVGGPFAHKNISKKAFFCGMQQLTKAVIGAGSADPGTHTLGFKEIRWGAGVLDLMTQVFPCARYIVNTRMDLESQVKAQNWGSSVTKVAEKTSELESWQSDHSQISTLIRLEEFSVVRFDELVRWLGVSDCNYTSVCHSAVGDTYFTDKDISEVKVLGKCTLTPWPLVPFSPDASALNTTLTTA